MMELGSIHPDEQSARRAVAMLLGAGIETERVKVIRPRAVRSDGARADAGGWASCKPRLRDAAAGATYGAALAALLCVVLTLLNAAPIAAGPLLAYACIGGTGIVAGAVATFGVARKPAEHGAARTRRGSRGWAVVVHARDADQRALAARALARSRSAAA